MHLLRACDTPVTLLVLVTQMTAVKPLPQLCLHLTREVYMLLKNSEGAHRLTIFHSFNSHPLNLDRNSFLQQAVQF